MKKAVILLTAVSAIFAEAPLGYQYDKPQVHQQLHHHDHLNGFKPSHGYPCSDGIFHQNSEGRVINKPIETSGEPILVQQLPNKQVNVNSQIGFGEHSQSQSETISTQTNQYHPPPPTFQQLPHYSPPSHNIQQVNFNSGSVVHGIGKAPPFNIQHHHHQAPPPLPLQFPPQLLPARPQQQYIPPRPNIVQQPNFHGQSVTLPTPSISASLVPPPIDRSPSNFLEQTSSGSSASFGSFLNSGSSVGTNTLGGFTSSQGASSSSNNIAFTSIGATQNLNHAGLDDGISQVISETFANAGIGENAEKHIYVHVPPADLEEQRSQHQHIQQQTPINSLKKHYKIIFIKAPQQQPTTSIYTQLAQQQQQTEEKTLVYVLVKKPEEPTIQEIQQIQSTYKPSKPEVYFIKYKARKEDEGVNGNFGLQNGIFEGSDLSGGFSGNSNAIQDAFSTSISESKIAIGNVPAPIYGPPA